MTTTPTSPSSTPTPTAVALDVAWAAQAEVLRSISRRVLWLAAAIVDAANRGRPNSSGVKVGGHQASSASIVDIMVALWVPQAPILRPCLGEAARLAGPARRQLPPR